MTTTFSRMKPVRMLKAELSNAVRSLHSTVQDLGPQLEQSRQHMNQLRATLQQKQQAAQTAQGRAQELNSEKTRGTQLDTRISFKRQELENIHIEDTAVAEARMKSEIERLNKKRSEIACRAAVCDYWFMCSCITGCFATIC